MTRTLDAARWSQERTWPGLVQHLTFVESMWFEQIVAGGKATRGDRSMQVDPSVSVRTLRAHYRAACAISNEIIAAVGDATRW